MIKTNILHNTYAWETAHTGYGHAQSVYGILCIVKHLIMIYC